MNDTLRDRGMLASLRAWRPGNWRSEGARCVLDVDGGTLTADHRGGLRMLSLSCDAAAVSLTGHGGVTWPDAWWSLVAQAQHRAAWMHERGEELRARALIGAVDV